MPRRCLVVNRIIYVAAQLLPTCFSRPSLVGSRVGVSEAAAPRWHRASYPVVCAREPLTQRKPLTFRLSLQTPVRRFRFQPQRREVFRRGASLSFKLNTFFCGAFFANNLERQKLPERQKKGGGRGLERGRF